nr:glycosyltransferase family 4 protein [Sulfitobacter maritimus]
MFKIDPSNKVVLFFGLLRPSKGVDHLLEAFAQVPTRHNARLVISGYPTKMFDTQALRRRAKSLGIEARCRFHFDYLPNEKVSPLMEMADLVVFPYRNATASGVLALAQSFAKPVIATRVGGLMEAVTDGETGITVPPEDPTAIAKAIDDLLAHPDKARRLGQNAKRVLAHERSWAVAAARVSAQLTPKVRDVAETAGGSTQGD